MRIEISIDNIDSLVSLLNEETNLKVLNVHEMRVLESYCIDSCSQAINMTKFLNRALAI